jgi:hypothetical protein
VLASRSRRVGRSCTANSLCSLVSQRLRRRFAAWLLSRLRAGGSWRESGTHLRGESWPIFTTSGSLRIRIGKLRPAFGAASSGTTFSLRPALSRSGQRSGAQRCAPRASAGGWPLRSGGGAASGELPARAWGAVQGNRTFLFPLTPKHTQFYVRWRAPRPASAGMTAPLTHRSMFSIQVIRDDVLCRPLARLSIPS